MTTLPTWGDIAQMIVALAAAGAMLEAMRARRKIEAANEKIEQVHVATNSMKDELVALTRKAALAEGALQARQEDAAAKKPQP